MQVSFLCISFVVILNLWRKGLHSLDHVFNISEDHIMNPQWPSLFEFRYTCALYLLQVYLQIYFFVVDESTFWILL